MLAVTGNPERMQEMSGAVAVAERPETTAAPKGGKGSVMTARITSEMRDALEAEAARTGRTLAQVAELWMEQARSGHATVDDLLGLPGVGEIFRRMILFANALRAEGFDATTDSGARAALVSGWQGIIARAVPPARPSEPDLELAARRKGTMEAASNLLSALAETAKTDPENDIVRQMLVVPRQNALAAFSRGYDPTTALRGADLLRLVAEGTGDHDKNVRALFYMLEGFGDLDLEAAGAVAEPLAALYIAHTAELTAQTEHAEREARALRRMYGLVTAQFPPVPAEPPPEG
jgi:hypothetical protein